MKSSGAIVKEDMKRTHNSFWWRKKEKTCSAPTLKPGDVCPVCKLGTLAYDGLFVLICSHCGKAAESGAFT